ncbi:MAG: translocation/assembly module TamB domain-containing protein, partial [Desulfohalobiaceae bacterium]
SQARQAELPGFSSPLSPVSLDLSGSTADFTTLHLERMVLKERTAMVTARGELDLGSRGVDARIELRDLALERLAGVTETGLRSGVGLDLDLSGSLDPPLLDLTLEGAVTDLEGVPEEVAPLIGKHISLNGRGSLQGSRLQVDSLQLSGRSALSLNGTVDVASDAFDLEFALAPADPAPLLASTPVSMDAPPQVQATLQGTRDDFTLELSAETPLLTVAGRQLHSPALHLDLTSLPETGLTGRAGLRGDFMGRPLEASLDLQLPGKELGLDNILLRSGSTELQGSATIFSDPYRIRAEARILAPDLSQWEGLVPVDGPAGSLNTDIQLRFDQTLRIDMDGEVAGLSLARASLQQADFELQGENLLQDPGFTATVQAGEVRWKRALLPDSRLTLSGTPDRISFTGRLTALAPMRGSLDLSGRVERRESLTLLALDSLQGQAGQVDFALAGPADIRFAPGSLAIRGLALHTDHGLLSLEGTAAEHALDVRAVMEDLDPALFSTLTNTSLKGRISGTAALTGQADAPLLEADFSGRDLQVAPGRIGQLRPFDLTAALRMTGQQTGVQGTISGFDPEPGSYRLQLPLTWSLFPWTLEMRRGQAVSGSLRSVLQLGVVSEALVLDEQFFEGEASVDIALGGTWSQPQLSGGVDLTGGSYENLATGTALSSISGSVSARQDSTFSVDMSGFGPGGGRVDLSGTLGVPPLSPLHYDLRAEVDKARLVQRDQLQSTATGNIRVRGDAGELDLSGRLTLDPTELRLRSGAPDMISIPIEEVNAEKGHTPKDQDGPSFVSSLDVTLEFPARLYVRGRGLDSEWQGRLSAGGTAVQPELQGRLQMVRGTYTFLGKRFQLGQGSITFDGASPPNPLVNLTVVNRDNGFEARVLLTGQPDNLSVTLESDPALPRDEILARVLFGRSVSELSALQALKLARTVGQLTGQDTGPDVLGETREFLGVDELEIGQGAAGGTTLGIGAYIHEDIYIKGEKGIDPEDDAISVEIEITPNIGLETEVGGSG